jgi:hypothetical protein
MPHTTTRRWMLGGGSLLALSLSGCGAIVEGLLDSLVASALDSDDWDDDDDRDHHRRRDEHRDRSRSDEMTANRARMESQRTRREASARRGG